MPKTRPYLYYDTAQSLCSTCFRKVDGKIVFQEEKVFLLKRCPEHGGEKVLLSDDVAYYRRCREVFLKPPEMPLQYQTKVEHGCPYDCGLCPDHEQHACLALVEVTDHCNLKCPVCYAGSGPERPGFLSLTEVEARLDAVVRAEGTADVVQLSGGEPTIHPDFFAILDAAKARPIRHLMVNSNGVRLAADREFVQRLAKYQPGFEIYLQFDSLHEAPLRALRGADLRKTRKRALEHLNEFDISTTLVVTLKKGLNDGEIGEILEFALTQPCVRGVTFQPIQDAGRNEDYDPARDRLTLSEVRRAIYTQCPRFKPEDILPVPCHPDHLAMAYALKLDGKVVPLTGLIDPQVLIDGGRNTIVYEKEPAIQKELFKLFSLNHAPESAAGSLKELLCCLPKLALPSALSYRNLFRIIIMEFMDARSLDIRAVKKACVMIATGDGRLIPFDTYNLFYRDNLEAERLGPLRAMQQAKMQLPVIGG